MGTPGISPTSSRPGTPVEKTEAEKRAEAKEQKKLAKAAKRSAERIQSGGRAPGEPIAKRTRMQRVFGIESREQRALRREEKALIALELAKTQRINREEARLDKSKSDVAQSVAVRRLQRFVALVTGNPSFLRTEGIFRIPPSASARRAVTSDPNTYFVKHMFSRKEDLNRALADHIRTEMKAAFSMKDKVMFALVSGVDPSELTDRMEPQDTYLVDLLLNQYGEPVNMLADLPAALQDILRLVQAVTTYTDSNMMTASALWTILAPNLMPPLNQTGIDSSDLKEVVALQKFQERMNGLAAAAMAELSPVLPFVDTSSEARRALPPIPGDDTDTSDSDTDTDSSSGSSSASSRRGPDSSDDDSDDEGPGKRPPVTRQPAGVSGDMYAVVSKPAATSTSDDQQAGSSSSDGRQAAPATPGGSSTIVYADLEITSFGSDIEDERPSTPSSPPTPYASIDWAATRSGSSSTTPSSSMSAPAPQAEEAPPPLPSRSSKPAVIVHSQEGSSSSEARPEPKAAETVIYSDVKPTDGGKGKGKDKGKKAAPKTAKPSMWSRLTGKTSKEVEDSQDTSGSTEGPGEVQYSEFGRFTKHSDTSSQSTSDTAGTSGVTQSTSSTAPAPTPADSGETSMAAAAKKLWELKRDQILGTSSDSSSSGQSSEETTAPAVPPRGSSSTPPPPVPKPDYGTYRSIILTQQQAMEDGDVTPLDPEEEAIWASVDEEGSQGPSQQPARVNVQDVFHPETPRPASPARSAQPTGPTSNIREIMRKAKEQAAATSSSSSSPVIPGPSKPMLAPKPKQATSSTSTAASSLPWMSPAPDTAPSRPYREEPTHMSLEALRKAVQSKASTSTATSSAASSSAPAPAPRPSGSATKGVSPTGPAQPSLTELQRVLLARQQKAAAAEQQQQQQQVSSPSSSTTPGEDEETAL